MFLRMLFGCIVGYVSIVVADYLIHRNVWHGRWPIIKWRFLRWWLRPHYVQHMLAHHPQARKAKDSLLAGEKVSLKFQSSLEQRFRDDSQVLNSLECTRHGMTVSTFWCHLSSLLLFVLTPHPIVLFILWYFLGIEAALPGLLMPFVVLFAHTQHHYYHMEKETRKRLVSRVLRGIVLSREFDILADDHQRHHYSKEYVDDCYSVMPFSRLILRPVFGKH